MPGHTQIQILVAQAVKNLPSLHRFKTSVRSLGQEDPLEKGMAIHSSILAWIEKPGKLTVHGVKRVGHD